MKTGRGAHTNAREAQNTGNPGCAVPEYGTFCNACDMHIMRTMRTIRIIRIFETPPESPGSRSYSRGNRVHWRQCTLLPLEYDRLPGDSGGVSNMRIMRIVRIVRIICISHALQNVPYSGTAHPGFPVFWASLAFV